MKAEIVKENYNHDIVCHMDRLTDDLLTKSIFGFVGKGYFRYVAGVSRRFQTAYQTNFANNTTNTSVPLAALDSTATASIMDQELSDDTLFKKNLREWQFTVYCAQRGSIRLLNWGLTHGYRMDARTCAAAAAHGQMDFLRYAREVHQCPWNSYTATQAARAGEMAILQYVYHSGCDVSRQTCAAAAESGRLDILQWLRSKQCPWDTATCQAAAERGDLVMLQWARDHGCPWDASTAAAAAKGGHLELLQWARAHGAEWSVWTCHYAAKHNHLNILGWAREQGCRWNAQTCAEAAVSGNLEILRWARQNGCPWYPDACIRFAESNGHYAVAEWVRSHSKDQYIFNDDGIMQLFDDDINNEFGP